MYSIGRLCILPLPPFMQKTVFTLLIELGQNIAMKKFFFYLVIVCGLPSYRIIRPKNKLHGTHINSLAVDLDDESEGKLLTYMKLYFGYPCLFKFEKDKELILSCLKLNFHCIWQIAIPL